MDFDDDRNHGDGLDAFRGVMLASIWGLTAVFCVLIVLLFR